MIIREIVVRFFGVISSETGHKEIRISTDAKNIRELIVEICDKYNSLKKKLLTSEPYTLSNHIRCYVNGMDIRLIREYETRLMDGDKILFLVSFAGG